VLYKMIRRFKNLIIVGTSHVASSSVKTVRKTIEKEKPTVIAIELDRGRLAALLEKKKGSTVKSLFRVGVKGWLFGLVGAWQEKKLSSTIGTSPGGEMKEAVIIAREKKIPVALIDIDVHVTLKNISKRITWKEKGKFLKDCLKVLTGKNIMDGFDLRKVPSEKKIQELTKQMKREYPSLYQTIVVDREIRMAQSLYKIMQEQEKVVAVIGAGHVRGILALIKKQK